MASQAEIDLVVNATRTLPELERDLDRVLAAAQAGADDIDVDAALRVSQSLNRIEDDLARVAAAASNGAPDIDVDAVLNQQQTLRRLRHDLDGVVAGVNRNGQVDPAQIRGVLDGTRTLRAVRSELDDVVRTATRTAPHIQVEVDIDRDKITKALKDLVKFAGTAAQALGKITLAGVGIGAAVPAIGAVVGAVLNIVPAAAVATQGLLAMQLATQTLKLGFSGVQDAISAAFDPETSPEDLAKAMDKLAPSARSAVKEIVKLKPAFENIRLDVQNKLFKNFDDAIKGLSTSVLPDVQTALGRTAVSLNKMGLGAVAAAKELGNNGTLDTALKGATKGIKNLEDVPGLVVKAFGQLAAASAPAFDRITQAVDRAVKGISKRLNTAFETGALDTAINDAIDLIKELGQVGANIFGGLKNVFAGSAQAGSELVGRLVQISQAFEDLTASKEFQSILNELSLTADALVKNVLPLLLQAFKELGPVIEIIGPPLRDFIDQIGPQLLPVIKELGPILLDLATIFRDQMPTAIAFVSAALKDITVVLNGLHFVLQNFVIPILNAVAFLFQNDLTKAVSNSSQVLATQIGNILGKFEEFRTRTTGIIGTVTGKFTELRGAVGRQLANLAADALSSGQRFAANLVAKAIQARDGFLRQVSTLVSRAIAFVASLPSRLVGALAGLPGRFRSIGSNIVQGLIGGLLDRLAQLRSIAAQIASTVANAVTGKLKIHSPSLLMFGFGVNTMQGFINGILALIPNLRNTVSSAFGTIPAVSAAAAGAATPAVNNSINPTILVQIGNEPIRNIVATEVDVIDRRNTRTLAQGVRR
jgi:hypothetical protein